MDLINNSIMIGSSLAACAVSLDLKQPVEVDIQAQHDDPDSPQSLHRADSTEEPAATPETTADSATATSTNSTTQATTDIKPTINDYLDYFAHSLECKEPACATHKCRNFKRLFGHFKQCRKHFECESCRWLLNLIIIHSKSCDKLACSIPLCFTIKQRINEKEVFTRKMESIKEFIADSLQLLAYRPASERGVQTSVGSGKRKFDELETADNDAEVEESAPKEPRTESNDELSAKQASLVAKLTLVRSNAQTSVNDNKDSCASLFEKGIRTELVKHVVQTGLAWLSARQLAFDKNSFMPVAVHVIKREQEIFRKVGSSDDYLYLMADLMHSIRCELEKRVPASRGVDCACQTTDEPHVLPEHSDESTSSKRLKLE